MENMLLLDITTFDPENILELFKRWEHVESLDYSKGLKVVYQLFDAGGGRVITLYEVETVKDYMTHNLPFTDLCQIEVFPVVESSEFKRFASRYMTQLNAEGTSP
ncbi:MAG: DUF3303 domain-containing protein [Methanosarcina sp.]|jgi:hypothetical protein|uniref:DUF3303 domain-containing protein n=1 Tax=Methanosarcina sp. TaxID=2213 RepID=UPI003BB66634